MQYNIYFRKDNWDRFKDEENKSKLINSLLAQHYGSSHPPVSEKPKDTKRPLGEILADIRETERNRDEELQWCQDEEQARQITEEAQEVLDALWREHNDTKENLD